ncbi:putative transporter C3H1.06c [Colletotrichum tanaceti]|uniref:Putative transporter C3H1.06c n=1 Tax=Colletotrichum tanaceti TaxID=1306861 RepID=A0A4U6XHL1_9PEZI|nr:putative transporter C3H1.06c [Colletotrichum tanaceti]
MQSDLMSAEFFAAAHGHSMNGYGVVTSSIHADVAYTLGEYMTKKLGSPIKYEHVNIANLKVAKGLVAQIDTSRPQLIRVTASTSNINDGIGVEWHNVGSNGAITESEPFATATVLCGDACEWLRSWSAITHLVESRIETLQDMILSGAIVLMMSAVPLPKRPLYNGFFSAVLGTSSVVGPLLGGAFTSRVSWRWCFYINLPNGGAAMVVIFLALKPTPAAVPGLTIRQQLAKLDLLGELFLFPSLICLLLALQ